MKSFAVMNIEKGEEIVFALVGGHITGTGRYKFLAKKLKNGEYEWAHYAERDNGNKEKVYRGKGKTKAEIKLVLEIMNRNLKKIFGEKAEMKEGIPEFKPLFGNKFDDSIN